MKGLSETLLCSRSSPCINLFFYNFYTVSVSSEASTSCAVGMESAAPILDTAMADAFAHLFSVFCIGRFSIIDAIKYPVKVSPAAVVSTADEG